MYLEKFFLSSFTSHGFIEKNKARVFFYYSLFMYAALSILILMYTIMPLPAETAKKGYIGASLIIVLVSASLIVLRTGNLNAAVWTYALPTIIATAALRIINSPGSPETAFTTYVFYMPYLIVFAAVFGRRRQAVAATVFFLITNWIVWFLVRNTLGETDAAVHTGVVNSTLGIMTTGIVSIALITIVEKYALLMRSQTEDAEKKLQQIQAAMEIAGSGLRIGSKLVSESAEMENAAAAIEKDIADIRASMNQLQNDTRLTADSNSAIVVSTGAIAQSAGGYSLIAEQASAAAEQITSSIGTISQITGQSSAGIETLVAASNAGMETAEQSALTIDTLTESSEALQEIVSVISAISTQTNMLAMNAAIEAAHAGESGKGFAIVAEEIRRLSEETALNSAAISDGLENFFTKIETAQKANIKIGGSFRDMASSIEQTKKAFADITLRMKELTGGTAEINSAVRSVVESSHEIKRSIGDINTMISRNAEAVDSLSKKSGGALQKLDSITASFRAITGRAANVRTLGTKSDEVIRGLDESIRAL